MAMNLPVSKKNTLSDNETEAMVIANDTVNQPQEDRSQAEMKTPPDPLVKASRDALLAKTAVWKAISQAFLERETSLQKAQTLAQAFDAPVQNQTAQKSQASGANARPGSSPDGRKPANTATESKVRDNAATGTNPFTNIIKSYFGNKINLQTKNNIGNLAAIQYKIARHLTTPVTETPACKDAAQIIGEAKSDRLASKPAISQAQEEIKKARHEAKTTRKDAEEAKNITKRWIEQAKNEAAIEEKATELIASQAHQEALSQATVEIKQAKEEVKAAKEAANTATRLAKDEIARAREEAETYKKNAQTAIAALEDKVIKVFKKVKDIKQQSLISISEAQSEIQKANEQAEIVRQECETVVKQANLESQKAMEEARRATEDAEVIKKAAEDAIFKALEEKRQAEEEAAKAKQAMLEFAGKYQEHSRKAREEAEAAISKANEAMIRAQKDIISMTISEISAMRQELETAVNNPKKLVSEMTEDGTPDAGQTKKPDPVAINSLVREMRAPLHSISGFTRLMLEDNITDASTRQEFLSIVVQQSENLTRLLDDLSGKTEPDNEKLE